MGLQNACHVSKVRVCVSETMTGELFLVGWGGGILHPRFLQRDAPRQDLLAKSYSRKPWGRPKQILMWADESAQPLSANSAGEPLIWCIKCNIRVVPWQDEIRLRPFFAPVSHVSPVALPCLTFWYQLHGPNIAPFSSLMLWSAAKTRRLTRTCLDFSCLHILGGRHRYLSINLAAVLVANLYVMHDMLKATGGNRMQLDATSSPRWSVLIIAYSTTYSVSSCLFRILYGLLPRFAIRRVFALQRSSFEVLHWALALHRIL